MDDALAMDTSQQKMWVATLSQNKPIQPAKRESQPFNSIVLADFEVELLCFADLSIGRSYS